MTSLTAIIDATVGVKKFVPDPLTPQVDRLLSHLNREGTVLYVPDLFYLECASAFWKYVRFDFWNAEAAIVSLRGLQSLNLTRVDTFDLTDRILGIALSHSISAYDASYVVLSAQYNAPLLTQDQRLVQALQNTDFDVRLFEEFTVPDSPDNGANL